jgi:hypothetical protein
MRGVFDIRAFQRPELSFSIIGGQLAQLSRTDPADVGALAFRCPTTQRDIESGIEMDRGTFQKIGQFAVQVCCAACQRRHEFKVANGRLAPFRFIQPCAGTAEFELVLSN